MSPLEQRLYYSLIRDDQRTVTVVDAVQRVRVSPLHARKILHTMHAKGALQRATRGRYLVAPPHTLAAPRIPSPDPLTILDQLCAGLKIPYYAAYRTAAFLHGLADQVPQSVQVAVPRWRRPINIGASAIQFHQVGADQMWGTMRMPYGGAFLTVSDPWRTLLDCAGRLDLVGGVDELVRIVREAIRPPSPKEPRPGALSWPPPPSTYASRFTDPGAVQRLGYVIKLQDAQPGSRLEVFQRHLRRHKGPSVVPLDPSGPPTGRVDYEWGVRDNVPRRRFQIA